MTKWIAFTNRKCLQSDSATNKVKNYFSNSFDISANNETRLEINQISITIK